MAYGGLGLSLHHRRRHIITSVCHSTTGEALMCQRERESERAKDSNVWNVSVFWRDRAYSCCMRHMWWWEERCVWGRGQTTYTNDPIPISWMWMWWMAACASLRFNRAPEQFDNNNDVQPSNRFYRMFKKTNTTRTALLDFDLNKTRFDMGIYRTCEQRYVNNDIKGDTPYGECSINWS